MRRSVTCAAQLAEASQSVMKMSVISFTTKRLMQYWMLRVVKVVKIQLYKLPILYIYSIMSHASTFLNTLSSRANTSSPFCAI